MLTTEPETQFEAIVAAVTSARPDGSVHNIEGIGWVRRDFLGLQRPNVGPLIYNLDQRPVVAAGRTAIDQRIVEGTTFTSATVRLPITDERAHRLLSNELRHFSSEEQNIFAVCVSNVPGRMKGWRPLALRWLQPSRNQRVGAIILFEQVQESTTHSPAVIRQRWQVIENPYAYKPVSRSLLTAINTLDEGSA